MPIARSLTTHGAIPRQNTGYGMSLTEVCPGILESFPLAPACFLVLTKLVKHGRQVAFGFQ